MRVKDPTKNLAQLKRFFEEVNQTHICKKCEICSNEFQKPVIDIRNALLSNVDVMFISEASTLEDVQYVVPFVGPTGLFFRKALYEAGISEVSAVLTNAVVCRPIEESGFNRMPSNIELKNCSERIKVFIETLQPKKICLVGKIARDFYTKKLIEWRLDHIPVFLIHHPAYVMRLGGATSEAYRTWVRSIREVFID